MDSLALPTAAGKTWYSLLQAGSQRTVPLPRLVLKLPSGPLYNPPQSWVPLVHSPLWISTLDSPMAVQVFLQLRGSDSVWVSWAPYGGSACGCLEEEVDGGWKNG